MNKVVLLGRLAADPELRQTPNGHTVTSFTIAVDRQYSKGADRQTDSVFLRTVSVAVDDQIPVRAGIALCVEPAKDVIEFQSA